MASDDPGQLSGAPLTLTRRRLVPAAPAQVEALRDTFAARHLVRLPRFVDSDLLADVQARAAAASFVPRIEHGLEIEETLADPVVEALLILPLNDPALFRAIDAITGCGPIGCFTGRVFRRRGGREGHYYPWHTDVAHDRLVGLTINLGREPFAGGVLQLRHVGASELLAEAHNAVAGDAMLFRIAEDIEHHVTPVTGEASRLTLAGWFRGRPDFWAKAFGTRVTAGSS